MGNMGSNFNKIISLRIKKWSIYLYILNLMVNYKVGPHSLHYISIWSLTFQMCQFSSQLFQCYINLVPTVIYWMEKANVSNETIKNYFSWHIISQLYHHISYFNKKIKLKLRNIHNKIHKIIYSSSSPSFLPLTLVSHHRKTYSLPQQSKHP